MKKDKMKISFISILLLIFISVKNNLSAQTIEEKNGPTEKDKSSAFIFGELWKF